MMAVAEPAAVEVDLTVIVTAAETVAALIAIAVTITSKLWL